VFGYPGGAVLPIYDEIFQQDKVQHILVRHEQGAGTRRKAMRARPARSGVVLVTSGPGATNAVTGCTDALMDSIPIVCITGQVPTHLIGNGRLPGMRHGRHHAALHQAQLAGEGRQRSARIIHEAFYVAPRAAPARSSSIFRRTCSSPRASTSAAGIPHMTYSRR
jgi:acetolactate synthase-1/2/3 large subunit